MHELGHTLGLHHGGRDFDNCKPNYPSVMSYALVHRNAAPRRVLDFSRWPPMPPLDETNLVESVGLQGPANRQVVYNQAGTTVVVPANTAPIDWDGGDSSGDGDPTNDIVSNVDINSFVGTSCANAQLTTLEGHDDWSALIYDFRSGGSFGYAGRLPAFDTGEPEITADEVIAVANEVDYDGDGFANAIDNCPAIANPDQADTDSDTIGDACEAEVDGAPGVPSISAPLDGQQVALPVHFSWEPLAELALYDVQISTAEGFNTLAVDSLNLPGTSLEIGNLEIGENYFWRVRATNDAGIGLWSSPVQFAVVERVGVGDPDTFTVGGEQPDFASFADAAASLAANGIKGPVEFLVRPGTYEEGGGSERVLHIADTIAGASEQNTITFRPDKAAVATVENVILQRTSGVVAGGSGYVAFVQASFVRLHNLTFQVADSSLLPDQSDVINVGSVVEFAELTRTNNVAVVGCVIDGLEGRGRHAVRVVKAGRDVEIADNTIRDVRNGIEVSGATSAPSSLRARVVGNHISGLRKVHPLGAGIEVVGLSARMTVSDNDIDYVPNKDSGANGIILHGASDSFPARDIEVVGNKITGIAGCVENDCQGNNQRSTGGLFGSFAAISLRAVDGGLIANNMIATSTVTFNGWNFGLWMVAATNNLTIAHNTIHHPLVVGSRAIQIEGKGHTITDNILVSRDGVALSNIGNADLALSVFDYNLLYTGTTNPSVLVVDRNTTYADLEAWQETGQGANSVSKQPMFVRRLRDLHLAECSVADDELRGTPLPEVMVDFDQENRDLVRPFMGMDEAAGTVPDLFEPPLNYQSGEGSWQFATGDVDGDADLDLVVTNLPTGSEDVTILRNDGNAVFSSPQHLEFGADPGVVKAARLNDDAEMDLIVSVRDSVVARFGTGSGGFSAPVAVGGAEFWPLVDFDLADYDQDGDVDVISLLSPPNTNEGTIYIWCNNGCQNPDFVVDFFPVAGTGAGLVDVAIGHLNDDGFPDLAIVDGSGFLHVMTNVLHTSGLFRDFKQTDYNVGVLTSPATPSLLLGDFDGDLDTDIVMRDQLDITGLILLRNNGDGTFAEREPIFVHRTRTPRTIAALDYDGDGDLDISTGNNTNDSHVLLNDGLGSFELFISCDGGEPRALAGLPLALIGGPLDADSSPDLAVLLAGADSVAILRNLNWTPVSFEEPPEAELPGSFALHQNYPNPFNPRTTIEYVLAASDHVTLRVFDILGRVVATLLDDRMPAGSHEARFDAQDLASGVYIYRLTAGARAETKVMVLLK